MISQFVGQYWPYITIIVVGLVLGTWAYDELEEADGKTEAAVGVGKRGAGSLKSAGGFLGAVGVALAGYGAWAGMTLGQLAAGAPETAAGIVTALLGFLGISGVISPIQYAGLAFVVLGAGALIGGRRMGSTGAT